MSYEQISRFAKCRALVNSEKNKQWVEGCLIGISKKQKNAFPAYVCKIIPAKFQASNLIRLRVIARTHRQTDRLTEKNQKLNNPFLVLGKLLDLGKR